MSYTYAQTKVHRYKTNDPQKLKTKSRESKIKHENKQTITGIGTRRFTNKHRNKQTLCNPRPEKTKNVPLFVIFTPIR